MSGMWNLSGMRLKLRSLLTALDKKELLTVGGTKGFVKKVSEAGRREFCSPG